MPKKSQMSKRQTAEVKQGRGSQIGTMRFIHNDVNFNVTYENHKNW